MMNCRRYWVILAVCVLAPSFFAEASAASARPSSSPSGAAPKSSSGGRNPVLAPSATIEWTNRRRSIMGRLPVNGPARARAIRNAGWIGR